MRIIHFTDSRHGSIDWELPPEIDQLLNLHPVQTQKELMKFLESSLCSHTELLLLALKLGNDGLGALAPLADAMICAATELGKTAQRK